MSEAAHTPGPWSNECFAVKAPDGRDIFHTGFGLLPPNRSSEAEANARLIAAAPDLLDACKDAAIEIEQMIEDFIDEQTASDSRVLKLLNAAIAKAEGRPT